jgi:DoxX-like family
MPGLVPGIHVFETRRKSWMAGSSPAMTAIEKFAPCLSTRRTPIRLLLEPSPMERAMLIQVLQQPQDLEVQDLKVSVAALWLGRVLSGLAILFLLFDGAIKLVPLSVVTETMDRIGYGSSETLARSLGAITVACTLLYAVPPTSFVGAILLTGYLGGAIASHVRIGSPLFTHVLFGFYLGVMVWGGLWLRDARLRQLLPFQH